MSRFAMMFAAFIVAAPLPAFADEPETPLMTSSAAQSSLDWSGAWTRMELAGPDGALQPLPAAAKLTFEVDKELRVSLSVGCNRIGTQIVPGEGNAVTFAPGMATEMACPGEIGDAEQKLTDAIQKVAGYETRGTNVVFLDATGKPLMLIGR
ncbi:META domain-containing protein [Mesorhizobium sp. J428]|uniref:META domain-containing protein n=1 Tax=Mesorhizobium sp. J428 TaxID=2898440 RepID=UPI002151A9F3|nr:META domain-containing protein [Mesorhizobium sp. J428]MCR5855411.1 META domain-containing protein [Mesorhizobium sp. J428]